jgi:hypothetical protein
MQAERAAAAPAPLPIAPPTPEQIREIFAKMEAEKLGAS